MITLSWQEYAEWLVTIQGMNIEDAIVKASSLYFRQYKRLVPEEEIKQFYDDRSKVREI